MRSRKFIDGQLAGEEAAQALGSFLAAKATLTDVDVSNTGLSRRSAHSV